MCGYLCGSNNTRWSHHLFSYNHNRHKSNILTYFHRFEFQKWGTLHIQFLVGLKNIKYIDFNVIRGNVPSDNAILKQLVNKCQVAHKSSLPMNEQGTHIQDTSSVPILKIGHPSSAYEIDLRAYIDTILPALKCSMDVQTTNGTLMLMKYVTSFVAKGKESFHSDALYTSSLSPATTAFKYAMSLDIGEPEMWALLTSRKLSWTNATRKQFPIPLSPELAASSVIVQKYYARAAPFHNSTLLQWLRIVDETQAVPTRYTKTKIVLVGLKFCSIFNPAYFFQYLLVNFPHRTVDFITPPSGNHLPLQILYFHKAHLLLPDTFNDGSSFANTLEVSGIDSIFCTLFLLSFKV